jgi:hypothetical protein
MMRGVRVNPKTRIRRGTSAIMGVVTRSRM